MKKSFVTACGGLLIVALAAGCGTTQAPSAARSPARSAASPPSVSGPASRAPAAAVPAGITQPPGGPVPAGFRAASVTFISTREAFVLGTAPCQHAPCTSIARTLDRGVSWRGLPAPVVPLGGPCASTGPAVWGLRFAAPEHGFVFGNGLWVTADGGGPWTRITALASNSGAGGIAAQAGVAAVADGSSVLATRNGGLTVTTHATPCPAAGSPFPVVTSVAVQAPHGLTLLCTGQGYTGHTDNAVYVSGDLGATWKLAGHPPSAGDGGTIAAPAPGHLTIATTSAASWL